MLAEIGGSVAGIVTFARSETAKSEVTVQKIRGNINVLMGSGGNIAVLTGKDGKVMVDAGMTENREKLEAALSSVGPGPVAHLINTHWHFDHTEGNEWLHAAGATIIAHTNTKKHLSTTTRVEDWDFTFPPAAAGAIPAMTFDTEHTAHLNGMTLAMKYYGPAHTDCDISVHFTEADVLHAGDTWWNGVYPFIDYSTGGSLDETIRALEENISQVSATTVVIPGHGPVGGRAEMMETREVLTAVRAKVAGMKKKGMSLEEVVAAKPTAAYDAKLGGYLINPAKFVLLVYKGV
ncbi:MBL fold metallo-hydrolase [Edaphobacter bradus]|uniref:MBL fold metallo-hydrolase n=1 Tax=Edaphobacter bradus TaxID=2259016 RepID=UPI0021E0B9EF|nr:MBL fold metallo-hydrolase [Edaphobacter bradus]